MPDPLSKSSHQFISQTQSLGQGVNNVWKEFQKFIDQGSVVDFAVGLVVGTAFSAVVTSFVDDLIGPIIGLMFQRNLSFAYLPMKCPANVTISCSDIFAVTAAYPTPEVANAAGIVTWNYGRFIQAVIKFFITAAVMFFFIKGARVALAHNLVYTMARKKRAPTVKDCPFCCSEVSLSAIRCPNCTSVFEVDSVHQIVTVGPSRAHLE